MSRQIIIRIKICILFLMLIACEGDPSHDINESKGIVKDYTGLDGCGFVIELSDGTKLEPYFIDSSFALQDGQHVHVKYAILKDHASICMVGYPARIYSIQEASCTPIDQVTIDFDPEQLPNDPFEIDTLFFKEDCIDIVVWYSGGCRTHEFTLVKLPIFCGTPPVPPPTLLLSHNANRDACEAYIQEIISFDLTSLQVQDSTSITFILLLNIPNSTYSRTFTYNY